MGCVVLGKEIGAVVVAVGTKALIHVFLLRVGI